MIYANGFWRWSLWEVISIKWAMTVGLTWCHQWERRPEPAHMQLPDLLPSTMSWHSRKSRTRGWADAGARLLSFLVSRMMSQMTFCSLQIPLSQLFCDRNRKKKNQDSSYWPLKLQNIIFTITKPKLGIPVSLLSHPSNKRKATCSKSNVSILL